MVNPSRIGGAIVIVLASSAVDRVFKPRSDQTKDYTFNICCLSTQHKEKETTLVDSES